MKLSTRLACHLSNIDIGVSDSTCIQSIVHFRLCWPLLSQPSLGNNYNYQTIAEFAIVTGQQSKFGCSSSFSSKLFPHPFSPEVQLMSSCCYPAYSVPSWLNSRDVTPSKATLLAITKQIWLLYQKLVPSTPRCIQLASCSLIPTNYRHKRPLTVWLWPGQTAIFVNSSVPLHDHLFLPWHFKVWVLHLLKLFVFN